MPMPITPFPSAGHTALTPAGRPTPIPLYGGGDSFDRRYYNVAVSAKWQWTEQWALTLQANKVVQVYGSPSVSGASTGVNLEISRQFFRKDL